MVSVTKLCFLIVIFFPEIFCGDAEDKAYLKSIFSNCDRKKPDFDDCLLQAFNKLNCLYKKGLPGYGVPSYDPHYGETAEIKGASPTLAYHVILKDLIEYNWTISSFTEVKTDPINNVLQFSQYFPYKHIDGNCDITFAFVGISPLRRNAPCSLTVEGQRMTTSIKRTGGPGSPLKVAIQTTGADKVDFRIADSNESPILNKFFKIMAKQIFELFPHEIDDLHSQVFRGMDNDFRNFPIDDFIK